MVINLFQKKFFVFELTLRDDNFLYFQLFGKCLDLFLGIFQFGKTVGQLACRRSKLGGFFG